MPRTLAVPSSFSSRRALSFSELSTSFSSLNSYSDYIGVNISLNNSSSLSLCNVFAPPIRCSLTDSRTDSFFPSRNLLILGDFICHHLLWVSKGTSVLWGEELFNWMISSDLLLNAVFPLNAKKVRICEMMSGGFAVKIQQCVKSPAVFDNFFRLLKFLQFSTNCLMRGRQ